MRCYDDAWYLVSMNNTMAEFDQKDSPSFSRGRVFENLKALVK